MDRQDQVGGKWSGRSSSDMGSASRQRHRRFHWELGYRRRSSLRRAVVAILSTSFPGAALMGRADAGRHGSSSRTWDILRSKVKLSDTTTITFSTLQVCFYAASPRTFPTFSRSSVYECSLPRRRHPRQKWASGSSVAVECLHELGHPGSSVSMGDAVKFRIRGSLSPGQVGLAKDSLVQDVGSQCYMAAV